ncbi:MAG: aldehyde ferredoxin oxidoreductase family protein [Deltaproteobacteria bacterium]|nr:aldehyde ferredoxin oxidoreductase family protein [Deltaproteobacteria bacterium]
MKGKSGYTGKILNVDLDGGTMSEETIPDEIYESHLSGMGLAAALLYDRIPAGADPLGPDNILGIVSGLLTGTGSFFTGRWMVVGKSPLTGGWGDANCGGSFAPAIKRCGYDGIFFRGISERPVYLLVKNGTPQLRDAAHLWGMDAVETEELLIEEHGNGARVACIGPAGENRSLISGISNDRGRLAARSGLGAVMGAKRLKAVVLAGKGRIHAHDPDEMKRLSAACNKWVRFQPPFVSGPFTAKIGALLRVMPTQMAQDGMLFKIILKKWGTACMNQMSIEMGDSPIKNWTGSNRDFGTDRSKPTNPDAIIERERIKYHCYSCPLGCGGICTMEGKYTETHKPEYETILALGGLCMNADADSLFEMNEMLNRAGMDTISAGSTVAFAIECYERGIITKEDTGGLELTWGNAPAIVELVQKMITREGIGDLLADGSKFAAERIGKNSAAFAMHAGGQDLPMHDGRNDPGFALHYSVEPTPGRHTIGAQLYYEMFQLWRKVKDLPKAQMLYSKDRKFETGEDKAIKAAACSKYVNVMNGAGLCLFSAFLGAHRLPLFEWLNAATGWNKTAEEYLEIGERIQTLRQAFNIKHGIKPRTFVIPNRALGKEPLSEGANKSRTVDIEPMIRDYWRLFGWDETSGNPKEESIKRLGIKQ